MAQLQNSYHRQNTPLLLTKKTKIYFKLMFRGTVDRKGTQVGLSTTSHSDCVITLAMLSVARLNDTLTFEKPKQIIYTYSITMNC